MESSLNLAIPLPRYKGDTIQFPSYPKMNLDHETKFGAYGATANSVIYQGRWPIATGWLQSARFVTCCKSYHRSLPLTSSVQ